MVKITQTCEGEHLVVLVGWSHNYFLIFPSLCLKICTIIDLIQYRKKPNKKKSF